MVRRKYSRTEVLIGSLCVLVTLSILTVYLWHLTEIIRLGYETGKLEREILSLREEVNKLEAQKSSLLSLERVERIARENLKLTEPRKDQMIFEDIQ